ncbi:MULTISPECIES: tyrosine-type recombinase/integrase [Cytobacillus]|uniref:Tyrosine-type recombinase/integrase n=1 Tax=Cytobacillus firmus TaxID=1399 RepID=A0AA46SK15_CYTFI|nr:MULTISPECIES: tyrosine-type recombinase/integrase [Cytobacillus]MDF2039345.1 tyrosine-type recombinase/integrase [Cytobacillus oceanisediminis]UYG96757.1 tyrosine-type recombinase/integrase [Cytobacillus firmus]
MLLKFAVQDFLEDREFKNVTQKTLQSYKIMIKQFENFCTQKGVMNVEDITVTLVKQFIVHYQKQGNNATTTNSKLQRVRAFLNYMIECEVIKENPAKKIKKAKEDIKIDVFTDYHIKQMLNYYRRIKQREKAFYSYRDYSIIVVLLGTGLRLTELCSLKWSDLDFQYQTLSVFGKNRKKETIPITEKVIKELSSYKAYCEQVYGVIGEFIFTNGSNEHLTPNAVQNIFKRLAKIMNFKDVRLSSHTFRHTFCQRCIHSGMSTFAVQRLMRHSSIAVTERYAAMWGNDLKEQNDRYNPLNTLDI